MPEQLSLDHLRVIELPEYIPCEIHQDFCWAFFYEEDEVIQMLDEQGFIDCPYCLAEIVGIE